MFFFVFFFHWMPSLRMSRVQYTLLRLILHSVIDFNSGYNNRLRSDNDRHPLDDDRRYSPEPVFPKYMLTGKQAYFYCKGKT